MKNLNINFFDYFNEFFKNFYFLGFIKIINNFLVKIFFLISIIFLIYFYYFLLKDLFFFNFFELKIEFIKIKYYLFYFNNYNSKFCYNAIYLNAIAYSSNNNFYYFDLFTENNFFFNQTFIFINYIYTLIYKFNLIKLNLFYIIMNSFNLSILLLPIIHIFLLFFNRINKEMSLILSIIKFNIVFFYFYFLNIFDININLFFTINWSYFFNINFTLGVDYVSLCFIFLSDLLNIICLLLVWSNIKYRKKAYELLLISCNLLLSLIFLSTDLFIFYFFFELILIPMFFLISQWGSRLRKIHASIQFFLYTIIGSLIFLFGLIYFNINYETTDILILKYLIITKNDQILLFLTFFLAFAIKVPIYPFHLWLPEAHVEAPTAGSVLLAGILLKLGTYGFLKFFFLLLPLGSLYFLPIINMLCIIGVIFSSFIILRQIDIKKIIAYSSVIHMNYTILGLFNIDFINFYGSYFLMLSHGIISSALFICIGFLYERYHTRIIFYYGNLVTVMPLLSIFFLLFTLGNIGFPSTSSFVGEFLIFIGLFKSNLFIAILTLFGLFISVIYSFLLYNKIFFFNSLKNITYFIKYSDLNKREFIILLILFTFMFFYGVYTKSFFNIHYYILNDLYFNSKFKILNN
jgi:proton-translocating NADH-quinone oxidoreductase chain M